MEESPQSRMTLRQVVSGQWQIPLFLLSVAAFAALLLQLRPRTEKLTFEQHFQELGKLAEEKRFREFYLNAETLRQQAAQDDQLAQIHLLTAQTRIEELKQRYEWAIRPRQVSDGANYEAIIHDYLEALRRNHPDPQSVESVGIYQDLALAYWCLNQTDKAITTLDKAITISDRFAPHLHRLEIEMYLTGRPENYLSRSMEHLEKILQESGSGADDRVWAFVRKAQVLIAQDREDEALKLLSSADTVVLESSYAQEVEFLRGRALFHEGQIDEADLILRNLLGKIADRGDIYAQIALELGKINYQQYRDHDAKEFYELVTQTQMGKDWYVAGKVGLAECAALQQRYSEALEHYQGAVDLLQQHPHNRAIDFKQIQQSLIGWSQKLSLLKQYDLALPFLEIEQKIASADDVNAAYRFAQMHARIAASLFEEVNAARQSAQSLTPGANEKPWLEQQSELIKNHFEQAGQQYLRVARLATGDDELYGQSLWQGATCYDKAGNSEKAIETWERFVNEREGEERWPRALFNLAQAYQACGKFAEGINVYETLRREHPKSLAAFDGAVPMARCYLAKDPPERERAEGILSDLLKDPTLTPQAPYFRDTLFELGEIYYNSAKYPEAINILTEAIDRYSDDPQLGKSMFLVGDSYRKSGLVLDASLAELAQDPTAIINRQKTADQRRRYLESARNYFDRVIDFYNKIPEDRRSRIDQLYLRHCWLYRADCLFDMGQYHEAAELYELATLRYQLTPTALAAFVQIVNCHIKMGNLTEARSSNQRAIWQLRKMPDEAFADGSSRFSRQQWQEWFEWTEKSNLW